MLKLIIFIYAQSIEVVTPNGGENWVVGNKYPIHWNWTGNISSVRIDYSPDGGNNWILVTSSTPNDGDYLWTIPNTVSSNCFVKISSTSNPSIYDISDGSFSIIRPSIDVKKPNGGEILRIGEYYPIHWNWTGQFSNVKIEYSTDGGSSWNTIVSSTSNDGEHIWQVPNNPSNNCLIKITNTGDPECFDISNNPFTIAQNTITVLEPNGGEAYIIGQIYPIYWDWSGSFSNVKIEYSIDGGNTWNIVVASTPNDGSYSWTIPNTPSNTCKIKITNTSDPNCYDISDQNFTILTTGIEVVTPNGGEIYTVGDACPIHWNWIGTISNVKIEYSIDGGATWNLITGSVQNEGCYLWTIPNIPTNECRIKITNVSDPNSFDISDANFIVKRPSFYIFDPDSGKELFAGETYPIHWNWKGSVSSVKLELWYKTQSGIEWWTITSNTPNDGSYYFNVPYYISDSCGIKITSNDDPNAYAVSKTFKIVRPKITVIYPNGGEVLMEGEDFEIIWNSNGNFSNVMLQYSIDNGLNWQTITTSTPNDGSYKWNVPSGVWPTCLIKVINTNDIDCYDISDSAFHIIQDTIRVIRPAFSDTFFIKHNHPIYWKSVNGFPTAWITYNFGTITSSTPNTGYYVWKCDTFKTDSAYIVVGSNLNTGTYDISDPFIIADTTSLTQNLRILAPLSGDTFAIGGKCYITWHYRISPPGNVSLYYSIDNGPWIIIASISGTQEKYEWTIPNFVTNNCRVKVEASPSIYSISQPFSIVLQKIKIISPNSQKEWVVGKKYYILWNWTGSFNNAVIDYSYDGGATWVNIASPTQNDGEYEWTIPNTPSNNCLIRIRNYENPNVVAISDTFKIKPQEIFVTSPRESDSFIVGRKYYITWDYTGSFSSVNIEYSTDGGLTWIPVATNVQNSQNYEWTIPNTPTDFAIVKVINSANTNVYGLSDTFKIIPQNIEITSPVLNSEWIIGRKYYITWQYKGLFPNVKIEYSYDSGITWNVIVENAQNLGNYKWTIPNTPSNNCFVKVSNSNNLNVYDISEEFRIPLQIIEITSPKYGDELISGRKYYITWRWSGSLQSVDIQYSIDNGSTWSYIATNVTNNGNYEWTVPTANSNTCLVKIVSSQNPNVYDISDIFSILPQQITITSPSYGDTFISGRKYYLTWRTKGSFTNADLWYSLDGGQNWSVIATNIQNNGYYEWSLPEVISNDARIKVANSAQNSVFSISDPFIISPPILEITSPTLGIIWYQNHKYYITWNQLGTISQINLFYSLDGGSSWNQIAANQQNQGNYEWTIPSGISSENARIKLVSSANSSISYVSDSFVIRSVSAQENPPLELPKKFSLESFKPNPFLKNAEIKIAIPVRAKIKLEVYDAMGRTCGKIYEGYMEPGYYSFIYKCNLSKGIYFLNFKAKTEKGEKYNFFMKILKM